MVATFPVVIEEMTLDDVPGVQEVERASFPIPWPANAFRHELKENKNARYIVAREGGRIVGYAGLWLMVDEAHITTFAVHPDQRRRRIGERLLVRLFEMAAAMNADWLTLEVRASNLAAHLPQHFMLKVNGLIVQGCLLPQVLPMLGFLSFACNAL